MRSRPHLVWGDGKDAPLSLALFSALANTGVVLVFISPRCSAVAAFDALAPIRTRSTSRKTFAILFQARALPAVATLKMLFVPTVPVQKTSLEGVGVALHDARNSGSANSEVSRGVIALAAVASFAELVHAQAVAVELEALASLAIATRRIGNLGTQNVRGRNGQGAALQV